MKPLSQGLPFLWHSGLDHSTTLNGSLRLLLAEAVCSHLAIHLLELVALIAVTVTLGIAKMITSRGPAALFRGLFRSGLTPVGRRTYSLAYVLALHTEFFTATGQDVLAGGPGTLWP